jgi:hypothetical protein
MLRLTTLLGFAAITVSVPSIAAGSSAYVCSTVEYSGATDTYLNWINNSGQIVGYWRDTDGHTHGFEQRADGTFLPLSGPSREDVIPLGINNLGQIVTSSYVINTDGTYAAVPQLTVAGYPDLQSRASGINDSGDVAGEGYSTIGPPGSNGTIFIFRRTPDGQFHVVDQQGTGTGPSISVGPINNAGVIVERTRYTDAYLLFPDGARTMLRSPGLPFDSGSSGGAPATNGLNNALETAGNTGSAFPVSRMPFVRSLSGRFSFVDCPEISGQDFSVAALNDNGAIAGTLYGPDQSGQDHARGVVAMPSGELPHAVTCQPSLVFGSQPVGTFSPLMRIWVGNIGPADLRIGAVYVGAVPGSDQRVDFGVGRTNCAPSSGGPTPVPFLVPWGDCFADIAFFPRTAGDQTGVLYVISDSPDSPKLLPVSGTGVAP